MRQLIAFNTAKGGSQKNLCLKNVRLGFGIPAKYDTAWQAWLNTEQHTGTPPAGLDVPVYFSYTATIDGVRKNYGHIGVRLKDGRFWSDGVVYASVEAYTSRYAPKYVGWGESVNSVKVIDVKGEEVMDTSAGEQLYITGLHRSAESKAAASQWNGQKPADALAVLRNAPEWQALSRKLQSYDSLVKQLEEVKKALQNEQSKPPKEVVKEVIKVVEKPVEIVKEVERFPSWVPNWLKDLLEKFLKKG